MGPWTISREFEEARVMRHYRKLPSEWDTLSAFDRAWAIQTERTIDRMKAYDDKLAADELNRVKPK